MVLFLACSISKNANTVLLNQQELADYTRGLADSLHAEIGVAFYDLQADRYVGFDDRKIMHAASTMKVPVMIEVFRQAETGKFSLDDSLRVKNQFHSIVDGSTYSLDPNDDAEQSLHSSLAKNVSIHDLVSLMITWSSNLATNLLIEKVGAGDVTQTMRDLGAQDIQVLRGVEDIKAFQKGLSNRTDAYDMMLLMKALATGTAASKKSCKAMIRILEQQHYRSKIPAGLPEGARVANKTGSITGIDHDCAIVYPPHRKPYVLVVLTRGIADHAQAQAAIAAISRFVYEALQPGKAS